MKKIFTKIPFPVLIPLVAFLLVSCGPSREEIDKTFVTKTLKVEIHTNTSIDTLELCTRVPRVGTDYSHSFSLNNGILYGFWRDQIACNVLSYRVVGICEGNASETEQTAQGPNAL